jgi:catechol 2,3-dioxygenase-like lactoylglutathione lyase family enzyme
MLGSVDAVATVAVKDLERARAFYVDKLGLAEKHRMGDHVLTLGSGRSELLVYVSAYAGTNRATAVTWTVPDVAGLTRALRAKGVAFEHYDLPGLTREGDVHVGGGVKNAWCKDPDGNILSFVQAG